MHCTVLYCTVLHSTVLNSAVDVGNYLRVVAAVGPRGINEPSRSSTVAGEDPD